MSSGWFVLLVNESTVQPAEQRAAEAGDAMRTGIHTPVLAMIVAPTYARDYSGADLYR